MKISSKREGDEADVDNYNVSVSLQNEDASKDVEFNSSEGASDSVPTSQQSISRSSETGSNQQQNQTFQVGTNPPSLIGTIIKDTQLWWSLIILLISEPTNNRQPTKN